NQRNDGSPDTTAELPVPQLAALLPATVGNGPIASVMHQGTTAPPSAHSLAISPPHWIPSIVGGGRHAGTAAAHSAGSGGLRYLRDARRRQVPSHGCSEGYRPIWQLPPDPEGRPQPPCH